MSHHTRTLSWTLLLPLVGLVGACSKLQAPGVITCATLPSPINRSCTSDNDCTNMPPLPHACGEGKCIDNVCEFRERDGLSADCRCMPGDIRTCGTLKAMGVQICSVGADGNPAWSSCNYCRAC